MFYDEVVKNQVISKQAGTHTGKLYRQALEECDESTIYYAIDEFLETKGVDGQYEAMVWVYTSPMSVSHLLARTAELKWILCPCDKKRVNLLTDGKEIDSKQVLKLIGVMKKRLTKGAAMQIERERGE